MIGKVLNARYELLDKIDAGGMAIVYLGQDQLLDREVAVKVLQPQFANNQEAVERFHQEAKAVASLSHTNIVNIFDIGQQDDLHYIVMEYIRGNDLKKELQSQGKLSFKRTVEIIKGVCRALIKAHRNNIVHCDIKPHNILLTETGTVKVTDFGIARAVTGTTIKQTDSIRGSAHYLSPEQAEGAPVSTKSDIYSLGIVLYELVSGTLPFSGDSSVSVALKHINEQPPPPTEVNSEVPVELERIILRAISKDPEARYNSVAELLRDLKEIEDDLPDEEVTNQPTMVLSRNEIIEAPETEESSIEEEITPESRIEESPQQQKAGRKKKIFLTLGVLTLIMFMLLGGGYYLLMNYLNVETVKTPDIAGKKLETARQQLQKTGLGIEVYYRSYSSEIPEDHIISQSPKPGEVIKKSRVVEVVVSKGAQLSEVPELEGFTLREAKVKLDKNNLQLGEVTEEYNNEIEEGQIIKQEPEAGTEVKASKTINLLISKGEEPQEVEVPELLGLRREEAIDKLRQKNLIVGQVTEKKSLNYREGKVLAQKPTAGSKLKEGSTVQLIISSGIRNLYNSQVRERTITVNVPSGQGREVKIVVKDDNGRRIVHQQNHKAGEQINKEVIIVGPAIIQVYLDGQFYNEQRLKGE